MPGSDADMRDKVAVITGGASGLGRATAIALAEAGADVVVADRDEEGGRAVAEQIGGHFFGLDVSDLEQNRALAAFAAETCGGIDLAFLNAGITSMFGIGEDFDPEAYRRAMGVNIDGVVYGTHAVLPSMKARGGGCILVTASLAGLMPLPADPAYTANKHAVIGFTRAVAPTLQDDGVRFNAVCPAFAETAILAPIRHLVEQMGAPVMAAEEVADAALELFAGDMTGECWFVQVNNRGAYRFGKIPGPRPVP